MSGAGASEPKGRRGEWFRDYDYREPGFGTFFDELPLWSAPFGLLLLEHVPLRTGVTVLDLAAGTGFVSVELAQRCGVGSSVIAVDPWTSGLDRLRDKIAFLELKNVRVLECDAAEMDLPEESVDLVVSNLGINNFENPNEVLARCVHVAKAGATFALTTNVVGHMDEFYAAFRETLGELGLHSCFDALDAHVAHRGTVDSVRALLEAAGLDVRRVVTDSFRMRFADGASFLGHFLVRLGFLPSWRSVVPDADVERTFAALERSLDARAARDGCLTLTVPMVYVEAVKPRGA
jgi:SAM-dependent methyltransferase